MEKDEVSLVVGINPQDVVQSGVDTFSDGLRKYLSFLQLPVENVDWQHFSGQFFRGVPA